MVRDSSVRHNDGPDFVGIGAQKAGTTWLYQNLAVQQSVWMPPVKEIRFFDTVCPHEKVLGVETHGRASFRRRYRPMLSKPSLWKLKWLRRFHLHSDPPTTDWYYSLFPEQVIGARRCGDITPAYATLDERGVRFARRVLKPGCKIIFIVRNPIDRAWSALKMLYRWRDEPIEAASRDAILAHFDSPTYRLRGDYARTIRVWRDAFGDDLGVFRYNHLAENPEMFLRDIAQFLALPGELNLENVGGYANRDPERKLMPDALREILVDRFTEDVEDLGHILPGVVDTWMTEAKNEN